MSDVRRKILDIMNESLEPLELVIGGSYQFRGGYKGVRGTDEWIEEKVYLFVEHGKLNDILVHDEVVDVHQ
jgi:hypothetical protein